MALIFCFTKTVAQCVDAEVKNITEAYERVIHAGSKIIAVVRRVKTNSTLEIKQAYMKRPNGETLKLIEVI